MIIVWGLTLAPVLAQGTGFVCFPTCAENDSKMLAIAGVGVATLAGTEISLGAKGSGTVEVGVYDGDFDPTNWDENIGPDPNAETILEIFADPLGDGTGTIPIPESNVLVGGVPLGGAAPVSISSFAMTNNDWFTLEILGDPNAETFVGSGVYFVPAHLDFSQRCHRNCHKQFQGPQRWRSLCFG